MMRTMRTSISVGLAVALASAIGCKGDKVQVADPQVQQDLDICKKNLAEKDKLAQALSDENSRLKMKEAVEITVSIEGNALTVRPPRPGEARPIDDKVAEASSKAFLDVVARSRGEIQKCYEQALKKNTGLQARTVTLSVQASFHQDGKYQSSAFNASMPLGDVFERCIRGVAEKWVLPTTSTAMTFKAQVSLTPS